MLTKKKSNKRMQSILLMIKIRRKSYKIFKECIINKGNKEHLGVLIGNDFYFMFL